MGCLACLLLLAPPGLPNEMLAAHNAIRARLHLPPLAWSNRLAAFAQQWADTLLARKRFAHRPHNPYGENLFEITGARRTPTAVVRDWASESRAYHYRSNTCDSVCGHYTQIISSRTTEVGCAVARNSRTQIWVCNYNPPGNIIGRRPY
ncbi:MAG: SCP-like extracellular [Bryobacterales bacterium]|nr:SCP-like extracellular [Bryobacterales bacterium]